MCRGLTIIIDFVSAASLFIASSDCRLQDTLLLWTATQLREVAKDHGA